MWLYMLYITDICPPATFAYPSIFYSWIIQKQNRIAGAQTSTTLIYLEPL